MDARYGEIKPEQQGNGDMFDVTPYAQKIIDNAGLTEGLCTVFVAHSTCGMTTIEHEPGATADLNAVLEDVAPQGRRWEHNERNADTTGHSHARAALIGPSVTIPFHRGELQVGVWQKVVCIDFDDRPRSRKVVVQLLGE